MIITLYLILQLDLSSVLQYNKYEHYGGNTKKEGVWKLKLLRRTILLMRRQK
mgnify:FL=1